LKEQIDNIIRVIDRANSRTITVFGDYCLDKYLYIDPARDEPSLETGLTAYQADRKALYPGAGGTIVNNLRSLGAKVRCVGLVGDDGEGYELLKSLERIGADTSLMVRSADIITNTYIKPMCKTQDGIYSEMNRLDIRNFSKMANNLQNKLLANLKKALNDSQGIMILEQFTECNGSVVTERTREELSLLAECYPEKFFCADSRGNAGRYRNMLIKCNHLELPRVYNNGKQDENCIVKQGMALLRENGRAVIVTLGENGAYVFEKRAMFHIPAFQVKGPLDIVGAGDATNAGMILGLTLGLTLPEAVLLGGCVASITIQQLGVTGTATIEQVRHRLMLLENDVNNA